MRCHLRKRIAKYVKCISIHFKNNVLCVKHHTARKRGVCIGRFIPTLGSILGVNKYE